MTRYRLPQALGGGEHEGSRYGVKTDHPIVRFYRLPGFGEHYLELPLELVSECPLYEFGSLKVSLPPKRTHVVLSGNGGANLPKSEALALAKALTVAAEHVVAES